MKLTQNKLEWFAQLHEQILDVAEKYGKIKYGHEGSFSISSAYSHGYQIDVSWTEGCRGCYQDMVDNFFLSNDILLNLNWESDLKKQLAEEERIKKERETARKQQEELDKLLQKEYKERQEYERLKEKYGE